MEISLARIPSRRTHRKGVWISPDKALPYDSFNQYLRRLGCNAGFEYKLSSPKRQALPQKPSMPQIRPPKQFDDSDISDIYFYDSDESYESDVSDDPETEQ